MTTVFLLTVVDHEDITAETVHEAASVHATVASAQEHAAELHGRPFVIWEWQRGQGNEADVRWFARSNQDGVVTTALIREFALPG